MTKRCENELIIIVKEIVADLMESIKLKKKQKLRNNEYYNLQNIFNKSSRITLCSRFRYKKFLR